MLPPVELMDFKSIKVERPVVEIDDKDLDTEVQRVFRQNRGFEVKGDDGVVETGDMLGLTFEGTIDGKPFQGGSSDHAHVTVGVGEFIPGFEEQLVGMKKGETRTVTVTFPADYQQAELAGKEAKFETTVLHIDAPKAGELNDDFAKTLGLESVDALRDAVKTQMSAQLEGMSRQAVKRQILDALDEGHKFDVPQPAGRCRVRHHLAARQARGREPRPLVRGRGHDRGRRQGRLPQDRRAPRAARAWWSPRSATRTKSRSPRKSTSRR